MGNGPGVSMAELPDGRFRVRWREMVSEDGGPARRVQRERVVRDEATATLLRAEVLRALETGETFDPAPPARAVVKAPPAPRMTSVDEIVDGYLAAQEARGLSPATLRVYRFWLEVVLDAFRRRGGLADSELVPAAMLNRGTLVDVVNDVRKDFSEGSVYGVARTIVAAWGWSTDDPDRYPGVPPAPRDPSAILPRPPVYAAGPAPTLAECDAVIRHLARAKNTTTRTTMLLAVVARWTGLRVSQVMEIRVGDLDRHARTLLVRKGKSRQEVAARRTIPVSADLIATLERYAPLDDPAAPLVPRRRAGARVAPRHSLGAAWEACTLAGEVRREVWAPETREIGRPFHGFRAAFQAALVRAGVAEVVIDGLVGHAGSTRSRHYVGQEERAAAMRAAVDALPPIDWTGPAAEGADNVVRMRR